MMLELIVDGRDVGVADDLAAVKLICALYLVKTRDFRQPGWLKENINFHLLISIDNLGTHRYNTYVADTRSCIT